MSSSLAERDTIKAMIEDVNGFTDDDVWESFLDLDFSDVRYIYYLTDYFGQYRPRLRDKMERFFGI